MRLHSQECSKANDNLFSYTFANLNRNAIINFYYYMHVVLTSYFPSLPKV